MEEVSEPHTPGDSSAARDPLGDAEPAADQQQPSVESPSPEQPPVADTNNTEKEAEPSPPPAEQAQESNNGEAKRSSPQPDSQPPQKRPRPTLDDYEPFDPVANIEVEQTNETTQKKGEYKGLPFL